MRPFSSAGTYGRFFTGQSTLKIGADLTVFELSDLSAREELRSVVLTAIMFLSSQAMRKDRSTRKRSEEHTSELQSLMRISYAVFCLKKKKHATHTMH